MVGQLCVALNTSKKYHVKSDKHEMLSYETVSVRGMSEALLGGERCGYDLMESILLSGWGAILLMNSPVYLNE